MRLHFLEELLAVKRIRRGDATRRVDAEDIVVADSVVDLQAEILLRLLVEVKELHGAGLRNSERVEDMVAAVDGEVRLEASRMLHRHIGADSGVQLRLNVRVCKEEEGEVFRLRRGGKQRGGRRCGSACGSKKSEKVATGGLHAIILDPGCYEGENDLLPSHSRETS